MRVEGLPYPGLDLAESLAQRLGWEGEKRNETHTTYFPNTEGESIHGQPIIEASRVFTVVWSAPTNYREWALFIDYRDIDDENYWKVYTTEELIYTPTTPTPRVDVLFGKNSKNLEVDRQYFRGIDAATDGMITRYILPKDQWFVDWIHGDGQAST